MKLNSPLLYKSPITLQALSCYGIINIAFNCMTYEVRPINIKTNHKDVLIQ